MDQLNDPAVVRREYVSEAGLAARPSIYDGSRGEDARDVLASMVLERRPSAVLEMGDVQRLPFADASFDVVIAAWMLYHVPDVSQGLREIWRVLRPGGALFAVTNSEDHLRELWELIGLDRYPLTFSSENGRAWLSQHFDQVEHRDVTGTVMFSDYDAARSYVASSIRASHLTDNVPAFSGAFSATRRNTVFVATK
jgi:ubiquinone/menaquinone biosynthesis C-methylase UbiE